MSNVVPKDVMDVIASSYLDKVSRVTARQLDAIRKGERPGPLVLYPPSLHEINVVIQALTAAEDRGLAKAAQVAVETAQSTKGHTRAVATALASSITDLMSSKIALAVYDKDTK